MAAHWPQHYQQPQYAPQPQQYQQPAPYGYQPQYPQQQHPTGQQYSPQQYSALQYPQQSFPPPQYPLQPYAPQQYPAQPYPQQQHLPPQHPPQQASYQQPYQQFAGPPPAQTTPQPAAHACYNCGRPDHWAQDCPEPRRDVPAGSLNPKQARPPFRAFKPNNAIVTKYPSNPPISQTPQTPQGYTGAPYSQSGWNQHAGPHAPPTPISAQSPAQKEWHPQYHQQYQQWQQSQRQSSHYPQGSPYQQQTYPTPTTPAGGAFYGPQPPNQGSPQGSQYNPASHFVQAKAQSFRFSPPDTNSSLHNQQKWGSTGDPSPENQEQQNDGASPVSIQPQSIMPKPHETTDTESEVDDLNLLDVPDLPKRTELYGQAVINLIGMPLPANFVVADALSPMGPPAPENEGRCQSKYQRNTNGEGVFQNIQDSVYWKDHKDDTIFSPITFDGHVVPFEECRFKVQERLQNKIEVVEAHRYSRSESRTMNARPDVSDMAASLESLERALEEAKAKQAELIRNRKRAMTRDQAEKERKKIKVEEPMMKEELQSRAQSATFEKPPNSQQDTEAVLASLGVTGAARPISKAETYNGNHNALQSNAEQSQNPHQLNGPIHYDHFGYPPPPPPPMRRQSQYDGTTDASPPSAGSGHMDPYGYGTNVEENGNGYFTNQANGLPSPAQLRSEKSFSLKGSYDRRDSISDEEETPARRQEDDVTHKLKRRQPQVAEAYSRRW